MKSNWFYRIFASAGKSVALAASKHERARTRPRGWRRKMRDARKRQRQARLAQHRK